MLEIELKACLADTDPVKLLAALAAAGFSVGQTKEETDIYYNGNDRNFRKTDEALRLRSSRILSGSPHSPHPSDTCDICSDATTCITYKGSKTDSRSQTRQELETAVGDLDTMKSLLDKLGYPVVMMVRKQRTYYHNGSITACLDQVEGLGRFLELEQVEPGTSPCKDWGTGEIPPNTDTDTASGAKKEAIIDCLLLILDSLGVPRKNLLQESYLELLMKLMRSAPSKQ